MAMSRPNKPCLPPSTRTSSIEPWSSTSSRALSLFVISRTPIVGATCVPCSCPFRPPNVSRAQPRGWFRVPGGDEPASCQERAALVGADNTHEGRRDDKVTRRQLEQLIQRVAIEIIALLPW